MRYIFRFTLSVLLLAITSCKEEKKAVEPTEEISATEDTQDKPVPTDPMAQKGMELLEKCLAVHGGMEKWNAFTAVEYTLDDNGKEVYQLTHLKDRRAYLKSKKYTVGFDGELAWAVPDAKQVSGESAAFYYDLDFYFFGVPFLLKDPGVNITYSGTAEVGGKSYESLKVTFGTDVGLTPGDIYFLYIDPETYMMHILTYSISFFNEDAPVNSAKVYSGYQEVQGLMMPTKMENFEWDADKQEMGRSKNHLRQFSEIKFLTAISDETIFEVPEGAVTEKVGRR